MLRNMFRRGEYVLGGVFPKKELRITSIFFEARLNLDYHAIFRMARLPRGCGK